MRYINDAKLLHMRSVAELMYERALVLYGDEKYAEDMYVLGLLHDIGYIYGPDEHGQTGSELMARNGYAYCDPIRLHGKTEVDESELTREVFLLQWCDMSVLPGGKKVPCSERLDDIGTRYGYDSETYAECVAICSRLKEHGFDLSGRDLGL